VTETIEFTAPQRTLIEAKTSTYVEACPGAGKTQAIVQRFIERPGADTRRGVALVSFTNAAVNEARSRCAGRPELLRAPNFVGTIDSFINRFIVAPVFTSRTGIIPSFRDCWRNVPGSTITTRSVRGQFPLDWFTFTPDGTATADPTRVKAERRHCITNLEPWQRTKIQIEASRQWKRNITRGVLDSAASRVHASAYLADDMTYAVLRDLLAYRFSEVIVDEVQDCCSEDVQVLRLLLQAGIRLIMVGDPDQGIYGFRGASEVGLQQLRQFVRTGQRLDGNFRSSPAICGVVDSLRSSAATDKPVGKHAAVTHAIQLAPYRSPGQARQQIEEVVGRLGFERNQLVVLAHSWGKARACAGAPADLKHSDSKLYALATAIHDIQDESRPPRARAEALSCLEHLLQQHAKPEHHEITQPEFAHSLGISSRAYRERALRLAMSLDPPFTVPPSAFKAQLAAREDARKQLGWSTAGLKIPKGDIWPDTPSGSANCLAYSTIHGYKGLQSPVVALIIPDRPGNTSDQDDGVHLWANDIKGESRSVLYVGASRAQQLLILAVHHTLITDVQTILDRDRVSYALIPGPLLPGRSRPRINCNEQAELIAMS
jgi:DNA helicase II / ATP-dependent DNA helicase PcrA